ncbi:hypothetical protein OPQ81_010664 [Rhizoctonia solani]|nr:hypothetical protein OPQ81_010664 [Rhizoctonia solani]
MNSIFTRSYTPQGSQYKHELNVWCDRIGIGHIRFVTDLTDQCDEHGHQLYQSFPIFPRVVDLGASYVGWGMSQQEAHQASSALIPWAELPLNPGSVRYDFNQYGDGSFAAKPFLFMYSEYANLTNAVGYATSRSKAEEQVAKILLTSGRHCFYR